MFILACAKFILPFYRFSADFRAFTLLLDGGGYSLGDVTTPSDALVFGAHLCVVFESENCHHTFLLRV